MDCIIQIPKGTTVFEYIKIGGYCCTTSGYLLYSDGRVYSVHGGRPEDGCRYVLEGVHKALVEQVEAFIRENWNAIQKLPEETARVGCCDGSSQYYKFLSKRSHGYMMSLSENGREVLSLAKKIDHLFHYNGAQVLKTNIDDFVECWGDLMDEITNDRTRRKILFFLASSGFPRDCEALGFEMDCCKSFDRKYGSDFWEKHINDGYESFFALIDDYQVLGNTIYSRWRYYNHWAYDAIAEFNAGWFKQAFKRLKELCY